MTKILRNIGLALVVLSLPVILQSCIKEEPLNAECDIEQVIVHMDKPEDFFFHATDTLRKVFYTDSVINFTVRSHADLTAIAPRFVLTEGATISPENGTAQDFSQGPVIYTVTSQDGNWHRRYRVSFTPVTVTVSDTIKFDFEHYELDSKYHKFYVWYNTSGVTTLGETWANGNEGYKLSMPNSLPEGYPTIPMEDGYDGKGVKLITRDTGPIGRMAGKPMAAGNLYIGVFDVTPGLRKPLECTRFGMPFDQRPVKLTGYYKYKSGSVYTIGTQEYPDKHDVGSIYAVLYKNHDEQGESVTLLGHDVLTNPNIVAIAQVTDMTDTSEWTQFEIEFNYSSELDAKTLSEFGYSLTIVFASSAKGDLFEGAVDSELCIDKVRLICNREE